MTRRRVVEALAHYQAVLNRAGPQSDVGDMRGLAREIRSWSYLRRQATRRLLRD